MATTFEGTLKHEDLGPGAWILETASGEKVALMGEVPAKLDGQRVRVEGHVIEGGMGIAMVGKMVEVQSIRAA